GLTGQQSSLFKEQTSNGAVPEGYRYGVQFDQNEAGLYDYATNQLLAKYIWGITPSPDYFDAEKGTVRICFKKDILKKTLPESGHCTLVRQ
ncbi:MAG: hypothetical protein KKA42_05680, partial [candidate division Zixibacteria bacterium]|nr:hypothetical protein [candidate division Zixibacteria bacterium]